MEQDQFALCTPIAFQVTPYELYTALAERLNVLAPFSGPAKTVLFSTGAEATENPVKIARAATGRSAVIAFAGGFHGRTRMTMAMTGKVLPYKRSFGPMPGEMFHVPFPVEEHGMSVSDSLTALHRLFRNRCPARAHRGHHHRARAGERSFCPAPNELLAALRELCDRHGIVLIADEVQTGSPAPAACLASSTPEWSPTWSLCQNRWAAAPRSPA